jgi:phytoene dehydrogenase-like protein
VSGRHDAVVIGSGPNGLAAAIEIARAGHSVLVLEGNEDVGGGVRTMALTLPGFRHDICSAIHPLALASPFFRSLSSLGVDWVHPDVPMAHPLDDGTAAILDRSIDGTAAGLGEDGDAYRRLMEPLVESGTKLLSEVLGPVRIPHHPLALARFGLDGLRSLTGLARSRFRTERGRALLAGLGSHAMIPLDRSPTAGFALGLGLLGHMVGWPMARGGSQAIATGLVTRLTELGGEIETGRRIRSLHDLPPAGAFVFDVTPRQLAEIAGPALPDRYRARLRNVRYGPGVFKLDWALDAPIPWKASQCDRAGTVHLGGTIEELVESEAAVWRGEHPRRPFVLLAQQSRFDPTRAPSGKHTAWAYCHVPHGSNIDMTDRIEDQIERFAPRFRDVVLARSVMPPAELERTNANHVGGSITGGVQDLRQLFTRPMVALSPYTTPADGIFICSSSTPPGGGVHGMCGTFAARAVVARLERRS